MCQCVALAKEQSGFSLCFFFFAPPAEGSTSTCQEDTSIHKVVSEEERPEVARWLGVIDRVEE